MIDSREKLVRLAFTNQRELNHKLDPNWIDKGWAYYRAVWRETAEVFDHLNWEWWKHGTYQQPHSREQLQDVHIELCDIFHFGLSLDIISTVQCKIVAEDALPERYIKAFDDARSSTDSLETALEHFMIDALLIREFNIKKFARACKAAGLTFEGLMAYYFGKSALNHFRQDNGYNLPKGDPNKYVKHWVLVEGSEPQEDNVFLVEAIELVVSHIGRENLVAELVSGGYITQVYTMLTDFYARRHSPRKLSV